MSAYSSRLSAPSGPSRRSATTPGRGRAGRSCAGSSMARCETRVGRGWSRAGHDRARPARPPPRYAGARMSRRSDQRRAAAFALYQHELTGRELDDLFEHDATTFTRALAYAAQDYTPDLDALIERHAKGWT